MRDPAKPPLTQEEYLEQVACDMPGGKPPSRAKALLLPVLGTVVLLAALLLCRRLGLV